MVQVFPVFLADGYQKRGAKNTHIARAAVVDSEAVADHSQERSLRD
ncbi:hypothetical protein [Nostoc sp. 'Peltigera malacea cyanobiont' DB3992]|nr:hypothetical protein [Nostoc sp. 'Peltigera malacea cyanobiont' DB3992]